MDMFSHKLQQSVPFQMCALYNSAYMYNVANGYALDIN
jgi:hypothetical protein